MKKNFFPLIAMIGGIGVCLYGIIGGGGTISMFISVSSLFIVLVGSFASLAIVYPLSMLKNIPKLFNALLSEQTISLKELPTLFEGLALEAKKNGILALDSKIPEIGNEFIQRGIQMVVDGIDANEIRNSLENEIEALEYRHGKNHEMIGKWAELAPAFGMIGTVTGLIIMLGDLGGDAASLGAGMAVALITTFYGSFFQNIFFTPMASNLKNKTAEEVNLKQIVVSGVLMIQSGVNPRMVKDNLSSYLSPTERDELYNTDISGQ